MKKLLTRLVAAVGLAAVATAGAVVAPQDRVATLSTASAITCQSAGSASASPLYRSNFDPGVSTDYFLTNYVPQGLTVWRNWNGTSQDIFLVSMYHKDEGSRNSIVYAVTTGGSYVGGFRILSTHASGIQVANGYLYVTGSPNTSVRRYALSGVRSKLREGRRAVSNFPYLSYTGTSNLGYAASFMYARGGYLYAGKFNKDARDWMYRYTFTSTGGLTRDTSWARRQVPKKAQGIVVTKDRYVFSTSYGRTNRSNIYVMTKDYTTNFETQARARCFQAPVLSEEITLYNGRVQLLFESGASKYAGASTVIKRLHKAPMANLRALV